MPPPAPAPTTVRNCLRSDKFMEIFFTTEKSNCTEVASIFFYRNGLYDEAMAYTQACKKNMIHHYRWSVYVPQNPTTIDQLGPESPYKKIKFVRCPYDRAVSSFFHLCRYHKRNLTFSHVLKALTNYNINRSNFSRPRLERFPDIHMMTQSLQEESENKVVWDHIIHVENLKNELFELNISGYNELHETLREQLSYYHWVKSYSPPKNIPLSDILFQDLDLKHLNYIDMYNPECRELVEQIYKIDFECHPEYTWEAFLQRNTETYV